MIILQTIKHVRRLSILPGPEVIKLFSCSTQLSMKFYTLISIKIIGNAVFLGSDKLIMLFLMFIKMLKCQQLLAF